MGEISPEEQAELVRHFHEVLTASRMTDAEICLCPDATIRRLQQRMLSFDQRLNRLQELVGHLMGALGLSAPD